MSRQINELVLPATLAVLLGVCPVIVIAAEAGPGLNINPLTTAWTAGEWVVNKVTTKPKPSFHGPERQARFDSWMKEDWIKDDPYACMWERNWIRKYKQDVCL